MIEGVFAETFAMEMSLPSHLFPLLQAIHLSACYLFACSCRLQTDGDSMEIGAMAEQQQVQTLKMMRRTVVVIVKKGKVFRCECVSICFTRFTAESNHLRCQ
jgi:hypothetical protein